MDVVFPEGRMGVSVGNLVEHSSVLYVEMVDPGGVAEQGGVKAGDVVSAVNGDHDVLVANSTPDLFVAYVSLLARPITLTFERTIISDAENLPAGTITSVSAGAAVVMFPPPPQPTAVPKVQAQVSISSLIAPGQVVQVHGGAVVSISYQFGIL
jgi:hypothetical protein